jgi:putative (di)nucleoside polyphosphate hydrolase
MRVDYAGYRFNVGIILINDDSRVFLARRIGHDAWQFPQGGVDTAENTIDALYRELKEEIGLDRNDVAILGSTRHWLKYRLPKQYWRTDTTPLVIGQKQRWFLLKINCSEQKIRLDLSNSPEFDSWRWVDYWEPINHVIYFKQQVYRQALKELQSFIPTSPQLENTC